MDLSEYKLLNEGTALVVAKAKPYTSTRKECVLLNMFIFAILDNAGAGGRGFQDGSPAGFASSSFTGDTDVCFL